MTIPSSLSRVYLASLAGFSAEEMADVLKLSVSRVVERIEAGRLCFEHQLHCESGADALLAAIPPRRTPPQRTRTSWLMHVYTGRGKRP